MIQTSGQQRGSGSAQSPEDRGTPAGGHQQVDPPSGNHLALAPAAVEILGEQAQAGQAASGAKPIGRPSSVRRCGVQRGNQVRGHGAHGPAGAQARDLPLLVGEFVQVVSQRAPLNERSPTRARQSRREGRAADRQNRLTAARP
jgi:hypothetical protein